MSPPQVRLGGRVISRRNLLIGGAVLAGAAAVGSILPDALRGAAARTLAHPSRTRLDDIKHVVILMQENRSFDHYFGTFPGVRGFNDPTAIKLPDGKPVFYQPDPSRTDGFLLPFHYNTLMTSAQATPETDHSWPTQHAAWDGGTMGGWIAAKGPFTMGYFTDEDIPFHHALARLFTVCDSYHSSVLGPTDPNRLYMWTGWIDPNGTAGGPVIDNYPTRDNVLHWTTYPERLEAAGISWQVWQEDDNYPFNALAWFRQYVDSPRSSGLWRRAMALQPAGAFEYAARKDRLPQVSWLVAPTSQTEHPRHSPAAGADYIAQKLEAVASNPDVWAKTLFILAYDENDGMFDHVPPPTPPPRTPDEFLSLTSPGGTAGDGVPIGLGFRVPCIIVSPWTVGGHVYSEMLDHTSLIRLLETRFGVIEPHISAWRRRTCGDLTGALNLSGQPAGFPSSSAIRLGSVQNELLLAEREVKLNPPPWVPKRNPSFPPL